MFLLALIRRNPHVYDITVFFCMACVLTHRYKRTTRVTPGKTIKVMTAGLGTSKLTFLCPYIAAICRKTIISLKNTINPLNTELNPICYFPALLGAHHFLHVSRIKVKSLTLRLLMTHTHTHTYIYIYIYIYIFIYIYMERLFLMFLNHTQRRTTVGRTPLDE